MGKKFFAKGTSGGETGIVRKSRSGLCSANPAPNGAVLVIRGGVFAVGLIGEYDVVGDGVGARAGDLAEEEASEAAKSFDLGFLLVVHIEKIELAGAVREIPGDALEQATQDGFAEGIEEEEQAGTCWKRKLDRIAAMDPRGRKDPVDRTPPLQIAASDAGQSRVQFHTHHSMERHFGGQQHGASHARTDVHEGELANRRDWFCSPPSIDKSAKDRGSDAVVSSGVAVVTVAALEMATGNKAAGTHAVGRVKWVTHEPIRHSKSGQEAAFACGGHACTVADGGDGSSAPNAGGQLSRSNSIASGDLSSCHWFFNLPYLPGLERNQRHCVVRVLWDPHTPLVASTLLCSFVIHRFCIAGAQEKSSGWRCKMILAETWTQRMYADAAKVVLPALATLIPAAVTAIAKWGQDHSTKRQSAALADRIASLAKMIAELPQLPPNGRAPAITPQAALMAEMDVAVRELTLLQTRTKRSFTTITSKMRSAFLLYKPQGWLAGTLHVAFFAYLFLFIMAAASGVFSEQTAAVTADAQGSGVAGTNSSNAHALSTGKQPANNRGNQTDPVANVFAFIVMFGTLGIPPLILRYFAARIHRKQCQESQSGTGPATFSAEPAQAQPLAHEVLGASS